MASRQVGFTLLELVIAMAVFALLGLASWTLFDTVLRVQQVTLTHERELRGLQRVIAVIERDLLHITEQPIELEQTLLHWQRSHWRNPQDLPRSERQALTYRFENGALWRESRGEGALIVQRQKLLGDVRHVSWRLFDAQAGWRSDGHVKAPLALEMQLSAGRFEAIRRVLLMPEALP